MSSTVHFGKGRSMTFKDPVYEDTTVAKPPQLRTETVRVSFDRATHQKLRLIARAERKSLTELIRGLAIDRARVISIYAENGKGVSYSPK